MTKFNKMLIEFTVKRNIKSAPWLATVVAYIHKTEIKHG